MAEQQLIGALEAGHILVTRDPRDTIGEHSGCPFHDNSLEGKQGIMGCLALGAKALQ